MLIWYVHAIVNAAIAKDELDLLRTSVKRGRPFACEAWVRRTAERLGLGFTLRDRGRPKKPAAG